MHEKNLVYFNLEPSNIMFKTEKMEEVVLLDFGIANAFTEYESMKIFGRDPSYCPPEITYENLSNVSSKSDIFSFGMLLFFNLKFYLEFYMNFVLKEKFFQIHKIKVKFII